MSRVPIARAALYSKSVASWPGSGSDELAMTSPFTAIVGVPMPADPGCTGVSFVIAVT